VAQSLVEHPQDEMPQDKTAIDVQGAFERLQRCLIVALTFAYLRPREVGFKE
jgi:hypothetical protein